MHAKRWNTMKTAHTNIGHRFLMPLIFHAVIEYVYASVAGGRHQLLAAGIARISEPRIGYFARSLSIHSNMVSFSLTVSVERSSSSSVTLKHQRQQLRRFTAITELTTCNHIKHQASSRKKQLLTSTSQDEATTTPKASKRQKTTNETSVHSRSAW